MDSLIKDIRYAIRGLIKRPGFVAIAVITLALGIGANTAIFSLVNTVLLRSLPVDRPGEIVSVAVRGKDDSMSAFSYPNYKDFRDRNEVLSGLLVYRFVPLSLSRSGVNERIWGYEVSGNYFDVLNVKAIQGRTFLPEEDKTKLSHPVIVVSYDCWQRRFGGDPESRRQRCTHQQSPVQGDRHRAGRFQGDRVRLFARDLGAGFDDGMGRARRDLDRQSQHEKLLCHRTSQEWRRCAPG